LGPRAGLDVSEKRKISTALFPGKSWYPWWVGLVAGRDGTEKFAPTGIRAPNPPARNLVATRNLPSRHVTVNTHKGKKKHTTAKEDREDTKEMKEAKKKMKTEEKKRIKYINVIVQSDIQKPQQ
jgi:hypothetical protein